MKPEIKKRIEQIQMGLVPEGYKRTKVGIVPYEWDVDKAKTAFTNYTNKKHNGDLMVLSATQERGIIPRSEVDIDIKYSEDNIGSYKKVEKGDFVISLRSFQGGIEYSGYQGLVSPAYTVIKNHIDINDGYYRRYFKTEAFISKLNSAVYGIRDGKQIGYDDFCNLYIHIPPLPEQEKIAEILSTWDKAIELKERLIAEKRQQKKWLIQNLVTGKKRLSGFTDEWKERTLGDCCDGKGYYGLNAPAVKFSEHLPRYLRITDIDVDGKYIRENNACVDDKESYNYRLNINDIVFARTGASVGKSYLYDANDGELVYAGFLIRFHVNSQVANAEFIKYLCNSKKYWDWVSVMSTRSGQPGINAEEYASFSFSCPSLTEQNAIANILFIAECEIDLHEQQLKQLNQQKKALMQLLLTGIVRVNTQECLDDQRHGINSQDTICY